MTSLSETLKRLAPWREPRPAAGAGPFAVRCVVEPPASLDEIGRAWDGVLPAGEAVELWKATRTARLFEDLEHGQWGLVLLPPADAARRTSDERRMRPAEFADGDVVIGEFLGDQDLLVAAPAEGQILVALPLDPRADWYRVASTLPEFLERVVDEQGAKFWEPAERSIVDLLSDLARAAERVPGRAAWADPASNVVDLIPSSAADIEKLKALSFPGEWKRLYQECREVRLADVETGYFIHAVPHVITDIGRGAPTRTTGRHTLRLLPFGSDGGSGLFGVSESGKVYYLPPGRVENGVYDSDSDEFRAISPSVSDFVRRLLAACERM